jgi:hypothetical protein
MEGCREIDLINDFMKARLHEGTTARLHDYTTARRHDCTRAQLHESISHNEMIGQIVLKYDDYYKF